MLSDSRLLLGVSLYFAFSATLLDCLTAAEAVQPISCAVSSSCDPSAPSQTPEPPRPTQTFGLTMYPAANFVGEGFNVVKASVNDSIPLGASYQIFGKLWAVLSSSSRNNSIVIWQSASNVSEFPIDAPQDLAITDIQSFACSPPCTGSGICSDNLGTCICPSGFNGTLCENCADGFFGSTCQPCPSNCTDCDQGISGTGLCLTPVVNNSTCASQDQCTQCQQGFFLASTGSCQVCQLGCAECADETGNCLSCMSGFTPDQSDPTKCDPQNNLSDGAICGPGSYLAGQTCLTCQSECLTCNGGSSNNCIQCAAGFAMFNTSCVLVDSDGICPGTDGMVADNNKKKCESCGSILPHCASCKFPNFDSSSLISDAICTGCIPGYFLADGICLQACPSGTVPNGNSTSCTECSPGFAFAGKCFSTCPSGSFNTNNTCVSCHPDCDTCEGSSFDQCLSCSKNLPVLSSGRCLPTCNNQTQFFNTTTSTCQQCDPSCSSCSGSGPRQCLACTDPSRFILRAGACNIVPSLGRRLPV